MTETSADPVKATVRIEHKGTVHELQAVTRGSGVFRQRKEQANGKR